MDTINILLVDDHKIIRDGIKLMLSTNKNFNIVNEASNGIEALGLLNSISDKIDIVLMDINMPEMNGIEATTIISEKFKNVKVLALTMHSEESYIESMIKAGAYGYILKESGIEELNNAVNAVYRGNKYYSTEVATKLINTLMNENPSQNKDLSDREIEVLQHVAQGKTNNEIGDNLNISGRTIETHRRNILKKLELTTTADLIRYAINKGLID